MGRRRMSWPTDGKPRFVLASIRGGDVFSHTPGASQGNVEFYIHDRAFCHRIVRTFSTGAYRYDARRGRDRFYNAESCAASALAELNAA